MCHWVSAALCQKRGTSAIRLPRATSIFNAELHAILLALNVVRKSKENTISCWQTHIQVWLRLKGHVDPGITSKCLKTYKTLTNSGKTAILCCIPGYVGIPGNEREDWVAKATLSLPISPVKLSAMDIFPSAKLLMHKEWQEIWNCCDGNKLHAINPTVGATKQYDSFSRRDAAKLNRLQIGHTHATQAHLPDDDETFCATCYTSLTVNHILIEYPQFNHLRQQHHFGITLREQRTVQ